MFIARLKLFVFALLALSLISSAGSGQPSGTGKDEVHAGEAVIKFLPPDLQKQLGVHKLTDDERNSLGMFISRLTRDSDLSAVARTYMENDGWKPVAVLGTRNLKLKEFAVAKNYLIVNVGLSTWAIEEPFLATFLPGRYWAKTSPFNGLNEMIDSRGRSHKFLFAESKELN